MKKEENWYELKHPEKVFSPSILVYPDRIKENIRHMINMIGDVRRLRPHIKTHKTAEIIRMQMDMGIEKFKCATIAEAELLGMCGALDVLLAMQPVGANINRYLQLTKTFPQTRFSTLVDNEDSLIKFSEVAAEEDCVFSLFLDLNTGMNRTGIEPGRKALDLYQQINKAPHLMAAGLHSYDGHIRQEDPAERKKQCDLAFERVDSLRTEILNRGMEVPTLVVGGSPSFPIHAKREGVEASPGTTLLWDERYGGSFADMDFLPAAVLLCRIVSKPADQLICLDLGHKSIAPEMNFPRMRIMGLETCEQVGQSEEHLVVRCQDAQSYRVGDVFYAIPMHICPTVPKYSSLLVVRDGEITTSWPVAARNHVLTI